MKKLLALLMVFILCASLCACTNSEDEFKTSYIDMYNRLQKQYENCDQLTELIYTVWSIVGTEHAPGTLEYMLQISPEFEDYWDNESDIMGEFYECLLADDFGWSSNSSFGISVDSDAKEFHALCMDLQNYYREVESENNSLQTEIKNMYSKYNEEFSSEYKLLNDLYLEISSYSDFSLEPSGSLSSYPTEKQDYQNNISKLIRAANIY